MARTGKWPARISLALSAAMIAALFSVISASGQQAAGSGILTVGIDVSTASITQVTYSIVVRNQGNAPTSAVRVRSAVPTATTFESSDPAPVPTTSPGTGATSCDNAGTREASGTTCEWSVGTLAGGETRTITAVYNLNQTNTASDRIEMSATASDTEGHNNTDTDESLVRQRTTPTEDTWVDDAELANTNHGACEYLRVLQGNRITSFVDLDALGAPPTSTQATQTIEQLFGAQLRLEVLDTTYSQQAPGVVGAHRITTAADWTEGSGNCQGAVSTTTTDARTGGEPASAGTPTGTTPVSAAAQIVNFDVTGDLDTEAERGNFNGWELRDQAASGTDNASRFHSAESTTGQPPQVFLVYETVESATCIDGDPEAANAGIGNEHLMTAFVTDGAKVPPPGNNEGSETTNGQDGCNGAPVAASVEWFVEEDEPDIYFSSQEGAPIQRVVTSEGAGPNEITTTADTDGLTGAGVKLNETPGTDNSNRIEVRLADAAGADPDPPPTTPPAGPQCGPVTIPPMSNCSGETAEYDDVAVTWVVQSSGSTSGTTGSTTTTTTSSGSSGSSSSASASSSSSSSASASSSTSSPSRSASTSGSASGSTGSQARSPRSISLFPSSNEVVFPAEVTVSGQITSANNSCRDAQEFVRIQRRVLGESEYTDFEAQNTNAEGRYEIIFEATESAEYIAVAPAHDQCMEATSSPESIIVKVKVTGRASDRSVKRGARVAVAGRVQPDHDGTNVVLQRRKGGRFVNVAQVALDGRSRYRFGLRANWRGRRTFRVLWRSQDDEHATNNSRNIVIRTTRP